MKIELEDLEVEKRSVKLSIYNNIVQIDAIYDGETQMFCEIDLDELELAIKLLKESI